MGEVVMFISFKLVKGASVSDFLLTAEELNKEFMSKQKGYVSWKQLVEGDTWADLLTFKTADDAKNVDETSCTSALAQKYYSFIDQETMDYKLYCVAKDY